MKLLPYEVYHVYNRGNNRQRIFFEDDNYRFFINKVKRYVMPYCDILAYTLMPNHFHFLLHANKKTVTPYRRSHKLHEANSNGVKLTLFSWGLQQLLSSYAKGINKQYNRTGSLFQQNTRSKRTSAESLLDDYSLWCFMYIHCNPLKAGIVDTVEDYEFCSLGEFLGKRDDCICNLGLAQKLLCLDKTDMFQPFPGEFPDEVMKRIF